MGFKVPNGSTLERTQAIVDILLGGATVKKKSNKDNSDKFGDLFADGEEVYNRLIGNARYDLDQNSHLYELVYSRVKGWRKNWASLYIKAANAIQSEIEEANPFMEDLPIDGLRSTYTSKYSWALIHRLFQEIFVGIIDWRETLRDPESGISKLYKNVFTYTML